MKWKKSFHIHFYSLDTITIATEQYRLIEGQDWQHVGSRRYQMPLYKSARFIARLDTLVRNKTHSAQIRLFYDGFSVFVEGER